MGHVICDKINAIIINWDMNRTIKDNEKHSLGNIGHEWDIKCCHISFFYVISGEKWGHEGTRNLNKFIIIIIPGT